MKILLAAATWPEISPLEKRMKFIGEKDFLKVYELNGAEIHTLITGVGMTATAVAVSAALARQHYNRAINAGICGSFNRDLNLGDVVLVTKDRIPELGAEDGEVFLSVHEMDLHGESQFPYKKGWIETPPDSFPAFVRLRQCSGVTVNTAHGNDLSIDKIVRQYAPDVESMEGAAFLMSALFAVVPAVQVRAVSNYVERRDRSKWDIPLAIDRLNEELFNGLNELT